MNIIVDISSIDEIEAAVIEAVKSRLSQRWYTLRDACEKKGVSYNTTKNQALAQPCCGREDARINGRRMWRSESVERWCNVTDENIGEYVAKCRSCSEIMAR